jgi:hypothetical protein
MEKAPLYISNGWFSLFAWLGGAVWVAHQPGFNFWDGIIWLYYVGRFVAVHFTGIP